jgi:hypothetical protein
MPLVFRELEHDSFGKNYGAGEPKEQQMPALSRMGYGTPNGPVRELLAVRKGTDKIGSPLADRRCTQGLSIIGSRRSNDSIGRPMTLLMLPEVT